MAERVAERECRAVSSVVREWWKDWSAACWAWRAGTAEAFWEMLRWRRGWRVEAMRKRRRSFSGLSGIGGAESAEEEPGGESGL